MAKSIHFNGMVIEILEDIYNNIGPFPCDICAVRMMCVRVENKDGQPKKLDNS